MTKIVVTHNMQRISALLMGLGDRRSLQKAVARSIKRTLPSVQRSAFNEIRAKKLLRIKAGEMKLRARAYLNTGASKPVDSQYGKVWVTPKAESLARFYARRVRAGKSKHLFKQNEYGGWQGVQLFKVKLNAYGAPYLKNPDRSFLVPRGSGNVLYTRMAGAKRLPIEKQYGPGMADLVQETGIIRTMADVAERRYATEFESNAKFYAEQAINKAMRIK
jgi:hypothetical protein